MGVQRLPGRSSQTQPHTCVADEGRRREGEKEGSGRCRVANHGSTQESMPRSPSTHRKMRPFSAPRFHPTAPALQGECTAPGRESALAHFCTHQQ